MRTGEACQLASLVYRGLLRLEPSKELVLEINGSTRVMTVRAALAELDAMGVPTCNRNDASALPSTPENLRDVALVQALYAHERTRGGWKYGDFLSVPVWVSGGVGLAAGVLLVWAAREQGWV